MGVSAEGIKVKVNSKQVGCLYDVSDIEQEREVKKKKCLTGGEVVTILGAIETKPITFTTGFDATDANGLGEAEDAFASGDDTILEIELSDTLGTNGTTFKWEKAKISTYKISTNDDNEVTCTFTLEPGAKPTVIAAA